MKTYDSTQTLQGVITKQGLVVMLLGLIAGFGWTFALLGEVKLSPIPITFMESFPGDPARWRSVHIGCLLYTSPSPRDKRQSRMPSSA